MVVKLHDLLAEVTPEESRSGAERPRMIRRRFIPIPRVGGPMSSLVATVSISGFFHEIVEEAIQTRGVTVTSRGTTYIVGLLAACARPHGRAGETMDRPL